VISPRAETFAAISVPLRSARFAMAEHFVAWKRTRQDSRQRRVERFCRTSQDRRVAIAISVIQVRGERSNRCMGSAFAASPLRRDSLRLSDCSRGKGERRTDAVLACLAVAHAKRERRLAGRQGFEPRYRGPEPRVLPLDDLPTGCGVKFRIRNLEFRVPERPKPRLYRPPEGRASARGKWLTPPTGLQNLSA
jgi:hypothetical protein